MTKWNFDTAFICEIVLFALTLQKEVNKSKLEHSLCIFGSVVVQQVCYT